MTTTNKRKSSSVRSSGLNYQRGIDPNLTRNETRGTRPTAAPTSIKEVLIQVVLHVCKKIIFFDTNLKVALYLVSDANFFLFCCLSCHLIHLIWKCFVML